jgi:formylglycine-generating enzyme required for sulfatase activity
MKKRVRSQVLLRLAVLISLPCLLWFEACRRDVLPETIVLDLGGDTQMMFNLIREGSFFMGSDEEGGQRAARPRHEVYLDGYYMGVTEVTNRQFSRFVEQTGYITVVEQESRKGRLYGVYKDGRWGEVPGAGWNTPEGEGTSLEGRMDHPVIHITWYDADAFCRWLADHAGMNVRIPTEAQWEKAARAGDDTLIYPWGREISAGLANVEVPGESPGGTVPVAGYEPNHYGLYDLGGNVSEWTRDWFEKAYYERSPARNPAGPKEGEIKSRRGGHWRFNPDWECRITHRRRFHPSRNNHYLIGFRCAIEPE